MITNEHIEQFIAQAHRVGDAGLTICSSGNISWRIGDEVLLSGTGSWVPSLPKEKSSCLPPFYRRSIEWSETLYGKRFPSRSTP